MDMKGTFSVDNQGIPLYVQLRDHLKTLIFTGILATGQQLPGTRQLADYLGINRHTVSRAIHELKAIGLVSTQRGRGTFVVDSLPVRGRRNMAAFMELVKRAVDESRALGFSPEELSSTVLVHGRELAGSKPDGFCIGFVECNPVSLERYAEDLRRELAVDVVPILIAELRREPEAGVDVMAECDLVVTTLGHMPEVRRILGDRHEVHAVSVGPYIEVFFQVLSLPKDAQVGIVTASELGSLRMQQAMVQAGISAQRLHLASLERSDRIAQILQVVDAAVVSSAAIDVVRAHLVDSRVDLIEYQNVLDLAGVESLRESVRQAAAKKASVLSRIGADFHRLELRVAR